MRKQVGFETYLTYNDQKLPSEKTFGLFFAGLALVFGVFRYYRGLPYWIPMAGLGLFLFFTALFAAPLLRPLNRLWFRLGEALHRIMTPLIFGALFWLAITPFAILFKIIGRKELILGFDKQATSYWISRDQSSPSPESMKNQF